MRIRFAGMLALIVMTALAVPITGCGDNDNSAAAPMIYVDGSQRPGTVCPPGTTEAYRERNVLVCHGCTTDVDCDGRGRCSTQCGPGCEDDTGGCCPVRSCVGPVG